MALLLTFTRVIGIGAVVALIFWMPSGIHDLGCRPTHFRGRNFRSEGCTVIGYPLKSRPLPYPSTTFCHTSAALYPAASASWGVAKHSSGCVAS
jgi:hypothetical protein